MKCLVINLDRSTDRLAHVTAEFERAGMTFERVAAVDALARPDLASMPMGKRPVSRTRLTDGEIACLLSHRICWSAIAAGDDAFVAIFEDDVVLSEKTGPLLADRRWIPADADIVKLETFFHRTVVGLNTVSAGHGFSARKLYDVHMGSAGYVVSKKAAGALLEATREIRFPVDHVLFNPELETSSGKVVYQLWPALCAQEQFLGRERVRFPSLLKQDRQEQHALREVRQKPRAAVYDKVRREVRRLSLQIADSCRLRRWMIVPLAHGGKRIRRPHTQRRENAL
ncbi:glycosyltransferase family 25 protein [Mesorhizobium sp. WSM3859]|uniref:glycosyltransferase family 25 protein n=1 Tax=Mesorhizobium sp. WSM3859 TaxID=2029402 RepID=UPI000BAF5F61|nr:glycosyltransferase family 25 protein [Mesorhizobium sp. WSM3859]PBC09898.1 glycosyl transferase [Mesorhizobium sp. WSM3859]